MAKKSLSEKEKNLLAITMFGSAIIFIAVLGYLGFVNMGFSIWQNLIIVLIILTVWGTIIGWMWIQVEEPGMKKKKK